MKTPARYFPLLATASCIAVLLSLAPEIRATTVVDNGGPNGVDADVSDLAYPYQIGDPFTLTSPATIRQAQWWGLYFSSNSPTEPDAFTVRFFPVIAGVPNVIPSFSYALGNVPKTDSGVNVGAWDVYSYSAAISDTPLSAGTYLFSVVNNTIADANDQWAWADSAQSGTAWKRTSDGQAWSSFPGTHAFKLTDEVPEPSSAALLSVGITVLLSVSRRCRSL